MNQRIYKFYANQTTKRKLKRNRVIIDFEEPTPKGVAKFSGELTSEEVGFLLRYALLSLLTRGMLPSTILVQYPESDDIEDAELLDIPDKRDMN